MTIAGGMVCKDGVLVYADTEWTASTLKIQRAKHWYLGSSPKVIQCAIAGAGDEDNLRLAIQTFWATLMQSGDYTQRSAISSLNSAVASVYANNVYPTPDAGAREFGMVVGIWTPNESPVLLKTVRTSVLLSDSYEYVYMGSGTEMAMYLSSRLDVRGVPTSVGELIAAFVLWETKRHVQTCGGDTVTYRLNKDGVTYRGEGDIRDFEEYFSTIDRKVQRIRVRTANLESSDDEFEEKLSEFCRDLRSIRKNRLAKLENEKGMTI
jgi:hypothetical protein